FLTIPAPPSSPLFPYTTLFRSAPRGVAERRDGALRRAGIEPQLVGERGGGVEPPEGETGVRDRRPRAAAPVTRGPGNRAGRLRPDRKSTRLNSSHLVISYAVFC